MTGPNLSREVADLLEAMERQAEIQRQQTEVLNRLMEHMGRRVPLARAAMALTSYFHT